MDIFLSIGFVTIWVFVAFYVLIYYLLIHRIKSMHTVLWKELGSPDLFVRNNRQASKPVWELIEHQKDALPTDPLLVFYVNVLSKGKMFRVIGIGYFVLFVLFYVLKNKVIGQ